MEGFGFRTIYLANKLSAQRLSSTFVIHLSGLGISERLIDHSCDTRFELSSPRPRAIPSRRKLIRRTLNYYDMYHRTVYRISQPNTRELTNPRGRRSAAATSEREFRARCSRHRTRGDDRDSRGSIENSVRSRSQPDRRLD